MIIEFTIPAVPPSLNSWSRKHWSVRSESAKLWRALVMSAYRQERTRQRSWGLITPPFGATVTLSFRLPRGGDADNRAKFVLDGLVGGVITDDRSPHLAELRLRAERGSPAQTTVRIEWP